MLAVLLLADRNTVPLQHLVDSVWPEGMPPSSTAPKQIRNTISELRQRLSGNSAIVPLTDGYRLDLHDGVLDSVTFTRRLARAGEHRSNQLIAQAITEYHRALALWRGPVLLGWDIPTLQPAIAKLNEQRLAAVEQCADLELAMGRHHQLVSELAAWTAEYPMRERLCAQFMLAMFRAGRQADAIGEYNRIRHLLDVELGVAPSAELQDRYQRILANDATLDLAPSPTAVSAPTRCDLPADVGQLTGRGDALRRISDLLQRGDDLEVNTNSATILAIDGMAGVGKTTLAVHAAHQLSHRYPDAQLFIDLQAHTSGQDPITAASALDRLLRALGLPGERIPRDLVDRSAEWRAQLARRRAIIVLDNASDASQLRPLLPGTANSAVLITTRRRLTGLDNIDLLTLDVLSPPDARQLFRIAVGDDRPNAEPAAADEILHLCGYLPLAIRIAASRLQHRPAWTVAYLASKLRDQQQRLVELQAEDRSVGGAFTLSYQCVVPEHQRFFRLLGLLPCGDVDAFTAAALTDATPQHADEVLEDLVDAHLLQQPAPGRYRLHDLVRVYAAAHTTDDERATAIARLVQYYLHTAAAAMDVIAPDERHRLPEPAPARMVLPRLADHSQAMEWMETEYSTLLAVSHYAAMQSQVRQFGDLSVILWRYFQVRDNHHPRMGADRDQSPARAPDDE